MPPSSEVPTELSGLSPCMQVGWQCSPVGKSTQEPTALQQMLSFTAAPQQDTHLLEPPSAQNGMREVVSLQPGTPDQVLAYLEQFVPTKSGSFRGNNTHFGNDTAKGPEKTKSMYVTHGYFITQPWGSVPHSGNFQMHLSCTCVYLKVALTLYTFSGIDHTKIQTRPEGNI